MTDDGHGATLSAQEQADVLASWRDRIFRTFPEQTARFLQRETDAFRNPVGERIRQGTADLLDGVLGGCEPAAFRDGAEALVRIRAVQGQPPSRALECIFLLKRAFRDLLGKPRADAFDDRIDVLALVAFDAYARCREEVNEIRVRETQRRVALLMRRFSDACSPDPDAPTDPADEGVALCGVVMDGGRSR
jgi:hypothetical protein